MANPRAEAVAELVRRLGHGFKDVRLLERALTHSSVGEGGAPQTSKAPRDNERLEFLGDRVLGLLVAERLHHDFPEADEGQLSSRLHSLVDKHACGRVGERMTIDLVGRKLVGRVGLDQQAVGRHRPEDFALTGLTLVGKVAGKTEVSSQLRERGDQLHRSAVAVQQEAARRPGIRRQQLQHTAKGAKAVDTRRGIALGGEVKLGDEGGLLFGHRRRHGGDTRRPETGAPAFRIFQHPAVEADLADDRTGDCVELTDQFLAPVRRAFTEMPRMAAEGGNDHRRMLASQCGHLGPVRFARAIDHHAGDPGLGGFG